MTVRVDGSSTVAMDAASPFPCHHLYDTHGHLIQKTGLIRYTDWMGESMEADTPWGGVNHVPLIVNVNSKPEPDVADAALVSGHFTEHRPIAGALLSEHPITETQVHILLDGILIIELDGQSVSEVGPGAIFDLSMRAPQSKESCHRARPRTRARSTSWQTHTHASSMLPSLRSCRRSSTTTTTWLRQA